MKRQDLKMFRISHDVLVVVLGGFKGGGWKYTETTLRFSTHTKNNI